MDKAMRKYEQCGKVAKKSNGSWRHGWNSTQRPAMLGFESTATLLWAFISSIYENELETYSSHQ
jgi:hypothetical protein